MKSALLIVGFIAACSANVIVDPNEGYKEGDRFIYFPGDGDGQLHLVDLEEPVDQEYLNNYGRNPDDNAYWLYSRYNPHTHDVLELGNAASVAYSHFNPGKDVVVLAHGWNGNGHNTMNRMLTSAFLQVTDVNIIVLDWSRLANRNYVTARNGVPDVGHRLGEFLSWLTTLGASYDRMHLVGFSLGGHLVGIAGRQMEGRVRRITALDPAGPLWSSGSMRIRESDGQYVEVIHTNTGLYGYADPCGDADHYPNGGSGMPGCFLSSCSHSRSYEYFEASIKYNHLHANECDTLRDATRNRCNGDLHPMGNHDIHKSRAGIFRVNTGRSYPY